MTIRYLLAIPLIFALASGLSRNRNLIRLFFLLGALSLAIAGYVLVFQNGPTVRIFDFNENLLLDSLAAIFVLLIVSIGFLAATYAAGYIFKEGDLAIPDRKLQRYAFFYHIFLFTMLLTVLSNNLGIMWIAVEGTTLASAFLVNVDDKKSSIEAVWKYLILCSVGIALALLGIIFVYYSAIFGVNLGQTKNLLHWTFLVQNAKGLDPQIVKLAFIFILVGYGTKAGLAPFHSWLPDAHSQAPSPVSAILSGVLLSCATFGIVRFHILTQAATGSNFSGGLLIFFGVFSVAVAVPFILEQKDYKRLLAYSSIEHMGLAVAGFGFGSPLAIYGALLHLVNHAFTKTLLFLSCGHLYHHFRSKEIKRIRGLFKTDPFLATVFFLGVLAISGMPPFSIFVSEFLILGGGFFAKKFIFSGLLLFFLIFIFAGFLRHASQMTLGASEQPRNKEKSFLMDGVLVIGLLVIVMMGFYIPQPVQALLENAGRIVQGIAS